MKTRQEAVAKILNKFPLMTKKEADDWLDAGLEQFEGEDSDLIEFTDIVDCVCEMIEAEQD